MNINSKDLKNGEPCDHPGCLNHTTHPCEGCGRIGGISVKTIRLYKCPAESMGNCDGCYLYDSDGTCKTNRGFDHCGMYIFRPEKPEIEFIDVEIPEDMPE